MTLDHLFQKRLLLVTGKGGVGKTVVAAALASEAARQGKRVCLVESSAEDQLGPLLGIGKVGHGVKEARENLFVTNLDPELNFRDFIILHLGFQSLFDKVFSKSIVRSFVRMIPGIAEITLLGRLYYYCELEKEHNFDLVILDAYASGHFLSLMATPDAVMNSGFVGPIIKETERVRNYIHDPKSCGVVLVNNPESLIMNESIDFLERLEKIAPLDIAGIFVNRVLKDIHTLSGGPSPFVHLFEKLSVKAQAMAAQVQSFHGIVQQHFAPLAEKIVLMPEFFVHEEPLTSLSAQTWFAKAAPCKV